MRQEEADDICRTRWQYGLSCRNCTLNGGHWCPAYIIEKENKDNGTEEQRKSRRNHEV